VRAAGDQPAAFDLIDREEIAAARIKSDARRRRIN